MQRITLHATKNEVSHWDARAAQVIALALFRLGHPDVTVYDGSWTEYVPKLPFPISYLIDDISVFENLVNQFQYYHASTILR